MAKEKKAKQIKAEKYEEQDELDIDIADEDEEYDEEFDDDFDEEQDELLVEEINEEDINEEIEEYEEAKKTFNRAKVDVFMRVFNIFFIIAMLAMIVIGVDVIAVARYDAGPFFAIKTKTYKDGGTKEYYGLGYKVIKYNELEGRRDTQIGFWSLKYSTTPTPIEDIDLAIEFQNSPEKTSKKYYKQYLSIKSKIKTINQDENKLVLEYTDPDGKYTLQIECPMASDKEKLTEFTEQQEITIKGTIYRFALKSEKRSNTVYLADCFAE